MSPSRAVRRTPLAMLVAVGLVIVPSRSAAQQRADDAGGTGRVPRELALALMSPYGFSPSGAGPGAPELLVGRAPSWVPPDLLRLGSNTEVLGSVSLGRRGSARSRFGTVIVALPGQPDSVLHAYEGDLTRAGWTRSPSWGGQAGGFVSTGFDRPVVLCRDSTSVMAAAGSRAGGRSGALLRLTVSRIDPRSSPCVERARVELSSDAGPSLPELRAPAGAVVSGTSGGATMTSLGDGVRSREISTVVTTTMKPTALAAHYASQLRAAGWSSLGQAGTRDAAVEALDMRDSSGVPWRGVLTVLALGRPDQRAVTLRLLRADVEE